MYSDLKKSIQSVYQKTGIDVFLFSPEGEFLFSAAGERPSFSPRASPAADGRILRIRARF